MKQDGSIHVELVYAEPERAASKTLRLDAGASVADALRLAADGADFNDVDLAHAPVGIFGKVVRAEQELKDGDRIEIYRSLGQDPKAARRARARQAPRKP